MQTKSELRKHFLARRRAISPEDRARWNDQLRARLFELPEMQTHVDVYIYVASNDEVETRPITEELLRRGRRVFAPIVGEDGRMDWGLVPALDQLRPGRYGLLEPPAISQRADDPHCGVAIVPCVAFTADRDRLGRGGGHYDRFLAAFSGARIGLAYEVQRADALPIEAHDVALERVVTESGTMPPLL